MAVSQVYVDPSIAGDSGAGTIGDPYGDLQYALNQHTQTAGGDQFNIKAGTAEMLAAALTFATYGTPTRNQPIIFRGYTTAANDGGIGVINGGGNYSIYVAGGNSFSQWVDLRLTNVGNRQLIDIGGFALMYHCEVDTGSNYGVNVSNYSRVLNCYIHDVAYGIAVQTSSTLVMYNYIKNCATYGIWLLVESFKAINNIVECNGSGQIGIYNDAS